MAWQSRNKRLVCFQNKHFGDVDHFLWKQVPYLGWCPKYFPQKDFGVRGKVLFVTANACLVSFFRTFIPRIRRLRCYGDDAEANSAARNQSGRETFSSYQPQYASWCQTVHMPSDFRNRKNCSLATVAFWIIKKLVIFLFRLLEDASRNLNLKTFLLISWTIIMEVFKTFGRFRHIVIWILKILHLLFFFIIISVLARRVKCI